jgi:phosphatidylserine/phosphatidylglycerophosphate/cardiolipin synthase-like enzyme
MSSLPPTTATPEPTSAPRESLWTELRELVCGLPQRGTNALHRFGSFARPREGNAVKWSAVRYLIRERTALKPRAQARRRARLLLRRLRAARQRADQHLHPRLVALARARTPSSRAPHAPLTLPALLRPASAQYLRRPPAANEDWRLDRLLLRKAQAGVKVYVVVYNAIPFAMPPESDTTQVRAARSRPPADRTLSPPRAQRRAQTALNGLHPNIACMRSPQHIALDPKGPPAQHRAVVPRARGD